MFMFECKKFFDTPMGVSNSLEWGVTTHVNSGTPDRCGSRARTGIRGMAGGGMKHPKFSAPTSTGNCRRFLTQLAGEGGGYGRRTFENLYKAALIFATAITIDAISLNTSLCKKGFPNAMAVASPMADLYWWPFRRK